MWGVLDGESIRRGDCWVWRTWNVGVMRCGYLRCQGCDRWGLLDLSSIRCGGYQVWSVPE